nr:hypothetical protein [Tanacetum cinerariifolium]
MTDYSLWEVILNGDSHVPTRIVEGVSQPVAPTTAEQRLARKNELKARGTLLMALPDKHQLKFNSHKYAKTLMEAIEKRFGGNTETKKLVSQLEIHGVSLSQEDVNLKFLRSLPFEWKTHIFIWRNKADLEEQNLDDFTTDSVSAAASVSAACVKLPAYPLPNIDIDDLEEMDLRWQMAMLTMRARRFPRKTGKNFGANGPTSMGFDMSKVECYNCHKKGLFARECSYDWSYQAEEEPANFELMDFSSHSSSDNEVPSCSKACSKAFAQLHTQYDKLTDDFCKSQFDVISYQTESDCESWPPSNLYDRFQPSSGYHVVPPSYTGTFMSPKPDLVFNTASIAVETYHLAFNVSDSDEESEPKAPQQFVPSFAQSSEHVKTPRLSVQPIETTFQAANSVPASPKSNSSGKKRNRKACFVCKSVDHLIKDCDYHSKTMAQPTPRIYAYRGNHKQYAPSTHSKPQKHRVPTAALTQSKPVSNTAVRPLSAALPNITVTRPRNTPQVVTKSKSPIRRHITRNPSSRTSNSPPRVNAVQVPVGNPQLALQDKGVIDSNPKGGKITDKGKIKTGKLDFDNVYFVKELKFNLFSVSQICDKKNSALFTDTECLVVSSDFKLPDESQVLLRVPRENNMYNVNLKNIVPSEDLTCLFGKATLDESNLWHRRLAHIHLGIFLATKDETTPILKTFLTGLENQLSLKVKVIRSDNETEFKNSDLNQFCGLKGIKREFSVPRTPQQNGIAERKNQTLIEVARTMLADSLLPIPFWAEAVNTACYVHNRVKAFRVFNSRTRIIQETLHVYFLENKPNVAGEEVDQSYMLFPVWSSVGSTNPQNIAEDAAFDGKEHDFDVKKPESIVILSPSSSAQLKEQDDKTMKEAKGKNSSQLPDDPDIPGLKDIIYSDDEDVVGAEADFNNLESSIPVSPIPITRIHKDHPVSQIIGDRSSTTQTRSMTRAVKDQDGLSQMFGNDFHTCMFTCFLLQEEPKRVKQKKDGIFINQDKYVAEILRKFGLTEGKSASTPIDTEKPLLKDPDGEDVDVHTYRSMIGSLMYLTSSRPDIMFTPTQTLTMLVQAWTENLQQEDVNSLDAD